MIWLLTRKDINPKLRYIDENTAAVVRAGSAGDARRLADARHGDEGLIWTDTDIVDCVSIDPDGKPASVLLVERG